MCPSNFLAPLSTVIVFPMSFPYHPFINWPILRQADRNLRNPLVVNIMELVNQSCCGFQIWPWLRIIQRLFTILKFANSVSCKTITSANTRKVAWQVSVNFWAIWTSLSPFDLLIQSVQVHILVALTVIFVRSQLKIAKFQACRYK